MNHMAPGPCAGQPSRLPPTALREPVHHADDRQRTRAPGHPVMSYVLAERAGTAGAGRHYCRPVPKTVMTAHQLSSKTRRMRFQRAHDHRLQIP